MRRHSTDIVSLVFGLIFLAAAGWWLVARQLHLAFDIPNGGWIIAGGLIALGVVGVAASLRRSDDPRPTTPATIPATTAPASATWAGADPTAADLTVAGPTVRPTGPVTTAPTAGSPVPAPVDDDTTATHELYEDDDRRDRPTF